MAGLVKDRIGFEKRYGAGLAGQGAWPDVPVYVYTSILWALSRLDQYRSLRGRSINNP